MNGQRRDSVVTDLMQGLPTLSAETDRAVIGVRGLMAEAERRQFDAELDRTVAASHSWNQWVLDPTKYLAELDQDIVAAIQTRVSELTVQLTARAAERGWEV